ncbi:MAG: GIY-YIG nuclease family protein, partial [Kiritimatiellae bacterium]|nr:GIY-YIG nuclease family protein [Kiritimatiellia bacterium]
RRLTDSIPAAETFVIPIMSYFVYILVNLKDKIYIGYTSHLSCRLDQHNDPDFRGTLHTKRHSGPWPMIHSEEYATRAEAMGREKQLKTSRGRVWIRRTRLTAPCSDRGSIAAAGYPGIDNGN